MVRVAPSILSADLANLAEDCLRVLPAEEPMLHFDVMDGIFVPNLTYGAPVLQSLKRAIPNCLYDVHLMILRPAEHVAQFAKAGADIITFHLEAESDIAETAALIHSFGVKAGLSLRPKTPIEALFPYLDIIEAVLVMSVEPGFGGQRFMPESVGRIEALREEANRRGIDLIIEVDGGINAQTAPACVRAGADVLVAGSAVFGAKDPAAALRGLQNADMI